MVARILQTVTEKLYVLIFRRPPGDISKLFAKNLLYSYAGALGSSLVTFAFSIWAVRTLGPIEYGKANLVVNVAQFLMLPLLFGLTNSASRYLARETDSRKEITSAIFANFALLAAVLLPIFWLIRNPLTAWVRLEQPLYVWAIAYAFIVGFSYIVQACLRGLGEFKKYALLNIAASVIFALSLTYVFAVRGDFSYAGFTASSLLRWLVFTGIAVSILSPLFQKPSLHWMKETMRFGAYHAFLYASALFFIGMIDNVMLNYYRGTAAVGLYSAYFLVFTVFSGKILHPFIEVLYPTVSALDDARALFRKTMLAAKKLLPLLFAAVMILIAVLFRFYGKAYPFSWGLAGLMSFNVVIYTLIGLLTAIIGSRGIAGARIVLAAYSAAAVVNVFLNALLIPRWNLYGVMIATALASGTLLAISWWALEKKELPLT